MTARGPIVAGYNGSKQARDGLALGKRLCSGLDTGAVVLSVLTYAPTETTMDAYERMLREDEARLGAEARAALSGIDPIEIVATPGVSPAHELHDLAVARGAAAIVLGSTHRGAIGRVIRDRRRPAALGRTVSDCGRAARPMPTIDGRSTRSRSPTTARRRPGSRSSSPRSWHGRSALGSTWSSSPILRPP